MDPAPGVGALAIIEDFTSETLDLFDIIGSKCTVRFCNAFTFTVYFRRAHDRNIDPAVIQSNCLMQYELCVSIQNVVRQVLDLGEGGDVQTKLLGYIFQDTLRSPCPKQCQCQADKADTLVSCD